MSEQYYDIDGNPVSLITLVKKEPEWAANRIRSMRKELEVCRDEKESLRSANIRLRNTVSKLQAAQETVSDLIDQSDGVYGLHKNGDPAPWDELLAGGRYEDWLLDFSKAQENSDD